jgi:hypothetical protein
MDANVSVKGASIPIKQFGLARIRQHRWWLVFVLAAVAIGLAGLARSWADCRFFYQAERAVYLSQPGTYGREPQMASIPLLTVLIRVGGQLLSTVAAWMAWAGGLYLAGLLLGQREASFVTTLKVVAWSWLPFVVRGLAQAIYMQFAQDPIFNSGLSGLVWDNTPPPPGGGVGYVMPTQGQQVWAALLSRVDLYLFWHLALVVSGLRKTARYPRQKAIATTLIVALALGALGLVPALFGNTFRSFRLF